MAWVTVVRIKASAAAVMGIVKGWAMRTSPIGLLGQVSIGIGEGAVENHQTGSRNIVCWEVFAVMDYKVAEPIAEVVKGHELGIDTPIKPSYSKADSCYEAHIYC